MTDIFTDCKKFNMSPGTRPLVGEYKKTVIIVRGVSGIGKSTLCELLINDRINFISVDEASIRADRGMKVVDDYLLKYGENARYHLGELYETIEKECCAPFTNYLFKQYILENENKNILVEGYLFRFHSVLSCFTELCRKHGYRIWLMERTL
jgi:hypothetical protein